ncbi:histone PARylation factor 1-like isoform X2 [Malaya genurostris]|uniref:histone PARylation factor 1-like isoform X2 n=1 Tax=Malaya genurostris TaxID=325434 RepID=UPI0026F39D0F|nr:histone PARylation factor 1-like isoform X2 [Malaya genurostris]
MDKPDCKYGASCYQKNPAHKEKFRHPPKDNSKDQELDNTSPRKDSPASSSKRRSNSPDLSDSVIEEIKKCKRPPTPEKDHNSKEERDKNHEYYGMTRQRYTLPEVPMDVGLMSDIYDPQIEFSKKAEYKELCENSKMFIKHKFLVDMPDCFDSLWKFCESKDTEKPAEIFEKLGLQLVGPFDVLAKKFDEAKIHEPGDYLRHWRFYFDPPEFQTVLVKKKSGLHYGYWRDSPDDISGLVAVNDASKGCEFRMVGQNVFDAVMHYLEHEVTVTPFNKSQITFMKKSLEEWCKERSIELKGSDKLKTREKAVVCKTFHKIAKFDGIDKRNDKSGFDTVMSELQPIVTAAFIAVDECDFGTALELAVDLFCHGTISLHDVMKPLFVTAYSMLKRPQYIAIMKSHLENRRKEINLDLLTK